MVGMETKPFHMMRFRKALGRHYSLSALSPTPATPVQIQHTPAHKPATLTSLPANPLGVNPPFQILHHQTSTPCVFAQPLTTLQNTHNRSVHVFTPTTNQLTNFHLTHSIAPAPCTGTAHPTGHQQNPVAVTLQLQPPGSSAMCIAQGSSSLPQSARTNHESTTAAQKSKTNKSFFLPPYLQPGSSCTAFDDLVDDSTPIQKGLGPCPVSPSMWDSQRAELIRKHSAIYGQNVNKRKMEKLSFHEENVNEAAQQLCMRDPTLLVRREELFILARRAVKEGGYAFHRGYSRAKDVENSSLPAPKLIKIDSSDDEEDGDQNLQPIKRRDQRIKRLSELEDLIAKNKSEQAVKLDALMKAQQASEFANAYHIQLDIESLGNACHKLQTEYSVLKRKQRRSERYFKSKDKPKETPSPARNNPPPILSSTPSNSQLGLDASQPQSSSQLLIHPSLPQTTEAMITDNGESLTGVPEGIAITTTAVQAISEKALEFEREKAPIFPTRHHQPTSPNLLPFLTESTPAVTSPVVYSQEGDVQQSHSGNLLYASGVSSPQLNQFHGVPPGLITERTLYKF